MCVYVHVGICVIRQDAVKTLHVHTASLFFSFPFFSFRSFVPGESAKVPKKKNERTRDREKEKKKGCIVRVDGTLLSRIIIIIIIIN